MERLRAEQRDSLARGSGWYERIGRCVLSLGFGEGG